MKRISSCHNKPIVRGITHGRPVCSQCGAYTGWPKKLRKAPMIVPCDQSPGYREVWDEPKEKKVKPPDTREMIRHFAHPKRRTTCNHNGYKTTDPKRVNCILCLRSEFYKEQVKKREAQLLNIDPCQT